MRYFDYLMKKLPSSPRVYGDGSLMIYALQEKILMLDPFLNDLAASLTEPQSDLVTLTLRVFLVWLVQYYKKAQRLKKSRLFIANMLGIILQN
ncbi:hypothetical protein [Giesbergeria anulus]|uniref:Uncharacterized protein n=1 Tax=Giesbergeria anulus TaxID=180197 RepID=A0A1H9SLP9_9BURK|nr:hypothetical protein [Giesbergeria anulus]SER85854.1 hypothetical protein SAMN02982919_03164 [Giesbergeria anulus]